MYVDEETAVFKAAMTEKPTISAASSACEKKKK
jgi:hypothetical protein